MINKLFWQKLGVAFVVGFFGSLVTFLTGLSASPTFHFDKAALVSALVGALTVGVRAVLALSPINLVPSDKQHSVTNLGSNQHGQVNLLLLVLLVLLLLVLAGGVAITHALFWLVIVIVIVAIVVWALSGRSTL